MAGPGIRTPLPPRTPEAEPFWQGCERGKLLLARCTRCDTLYFWRRAGCPRCRAVDVRWVEASGRGRLYSYVIAHHQGDAIIANVELEEGPQVMADLLGVDGESPEELRVDMPVELAFRPGDERGPAYGFRPVWSSAR